MHQNHQHPHTAGSIQHKPSGPWADTEHRPREKRRLLLTLLLTGITMIIEIIGGLMSGSLALLSDAGHMFTHALSLLISYLAIVFASRPSSDQHTFGLYRLEVLAAFVNGLTMFLVAGFICYEGIQRLLQPRPIHSTEMIVIAVVGLLVNLASALILARVSRGDRNVRSAFLHMMGDTLSSVGVVGCGILIYYTGWIASDAIVSIFIALIISYWGVQLVRDSAHVLLETTPRHLDVNKVTRDLCGAVPEIHALHDVHIWEITSHMYAMTAHATIDDVSVRATHNIAEKFCRAAEEQFNITHANIQFEFGQK